MNIDDEIPPNIYETIPPPAYSAVPNINTPVPSSHQNVITTQPPYGVPVEPMVWNIPPGAPQWRSGTIMPDTKNFSSPFYRTFLASKPKALGTVLILTAFLQIALGIGLIYSVDNISFNIGIPFWAPVIYIITGSVTIEAQKCPHICLVKATLSLNVISLIFSLAALILNSIDLATIHCNYFYNYNYYYHYYDNYYNSADFYRNCLQQLVTGYVVESLLLVTNLLLVSVSFSVSICGCCSLLRLPQNHSQIYLIQTDVLASMNPSTTIPAFPPPPQPPRYTAENVTAGPAT